MSLRTLVAALACASAMTAIASPWPAFALLVKPIVLEMTTTGSDANSTIEVVNDRNTPVTVELTVEKLKVPERGAVETEADAGDDFLIFPPQAIIAPGGRQNFRVRWVGEPALDQTRLFMFTTSELPVEIPEGTTGVQLYYAVQSVVAVSTADAKADVSIRQVERSENGDQKGVLVSFANQGSKHAFISAAQIELRSGAWRRTVSEQELGSAFGLGLVPPKGSRTMFLPVEDVPADGAIAWTYTPTAPR